MSPLNSESAANECVEIAPDQLVSMAQSQVYLAELDLNYIIDSMCDVAYPLPRWTRRDAQHCCQLYKNFLWLQKKYKTQRLVPTREIDEFWHNHILHTQYYFRDCKAIFGYYLHHQPESATGNLEALQKAFHITKKLYMDEFKQPLMLYFAQDSS